MHYTHIPALSLYTTWLLASHALCVVNVYISIVGSIQQGHASQPYHFRCTNLAPNTCCASTTPNGIMGLVGDAASFTGLPAGSVSALWTWYNSPSLPVRSTVRCTQQIIECSSESDWTYVAPFARLITETRRVITGASYFGQPLDPPDLSGGNPDIVTAELNALGLHADEMPQGLAAQILGSCFPSQNGNRARAVNRIASNAILASDEPKWVYPDTIVYNGTEFTNNHRNDSVYRDSRGIMLDLNLLQ